jgi:hypothetical protein
MSAHTKGPWQVHSEYNPWVVIGNIGTYGFDSICDCDQDSHSKLSNEEAKANARLIAAAPELLEALKDLLSRSEHDEYYASESDAAEAAIAKAEGR